MCSYIVEKATVSGSAKGANGWMRIDTANVYYDHPFHAPLDHALGIDFICEAAGGRDRVIERSLRARVGREDSRRARQRRSRARQGGAPLHAAGRIGSSARQPPVEQEEAP